MEEFGNSYVLAPMPSKRWRYKMIREGFDLPRRRLGANVWLKLPLDWTSQTYRTQDGYLGIICNSSGVPQYWFRPSCSLHQAMFEAIPGDVAESLFTEKQVLAGDVLQGMPG